jgi:hypothetical protein
MLVDWLFPSVEGFWKVRKADIFDNGMKERSRNREGEIQN